MYLEKLEIRGFKSFANKNLLIFPGMLGTEKRGITAIVGPNGSGKSNIADAVRWVLGEQSMKTLRGKRSEDVIFSGSAKLGRLGMAEVSLFLNNEDRKVPVDYAELVLTRRLYRDGASEYLLNNNRVRLSDIQIMLAKASFGQKTYSVIGQGMVEGFLNTSLSERKEFFDEATGIKQYQIKRDEALNKLLGSHENLEQAQLILTEIEPRLRSLTKQVNRLHRRGELESGLKDLQLNYYRALWHENNDKYNTFNKNYLDLEKVKLEKERKLTAINQKLEQLEKQQGVAERFVQHQSELAKLHERKEAAGRQLAKIDAQLEVGLEASGRFDLSWLKKKITELELDRERIDREAASAKDDLRSIESEEEKIKNALDKSDDRIRELNQQLSRTAAASDTDNLARISRELKELFAKLETAELHNDLAQVRSLIKEIKNDLRQIMSRAGQARPDKTFEKIRREIELAMKEREETTSSLRESGVAAARLSERMKQLERNGTAIAAELERLSAQLAQAGGDDHDILGVKKSLLEELSGIQKKEQDVKTALKELSEEETAERNQLFELQKNLQKLQAEINDLTRDLNEIKINATRFETRLEDLENEIRKELGGLKDVQIKKNTETIDQQAAADQIQALKKQLDLIGGIDPEIEKEYIETKERYDFLSHQTKDLSATIGTLEKVIKELDLIIKERFDKEFKIIANKFEEYFKILFNGGRAEIIKVMEGEEEQGEAPVIVEEAAEGEKKKLPDKTAESASELRRIKYLQKHNATGLAGIEIQATPPGKKIKSIAMLSGGERALTAIALICAIINVNPSPFVVLDEVDAALDEANSERLAKILDDLSRKTQFIVITHNRASMRRANVLYGITMGDDGVSKLLSIKLDEAETQVTNG